jgi:5-methylcytosine-specific restriction endonuclease McrA
MVMRACSICGRAHSNRGGRCDLHKIPARTGTYSRNAAKVRANATVCHICGKGFTAADPAVADHVYPRGYGGSDDLSNLRPAHRSCNGRKGASLGNYHGRDLYSGGFPTRADRVRPAGLL